VRACVCVRVCMCVRVCACVCVRVCVHRRQQRRAEPAVQREVLGHVNVVALQLQHGADKGVDGIREFVALEALVDSSGPLAHSSVVEHVVGPCVQRDGLDLGLAETGLPFHRLNTLELVEFSEVCKRVKRDLVYRYKCVKRDLVYR
jgi:hypothetical protein